MTKIQLNKFRETLEAKHAELVDVVRKRDGIAIENSPDTLDGSTPSVEWEFAPWNLDHQFRLLHNVRAALHRIQQGTFGICAQCDEEISPRRLAAMPWALLCIRCQELADHKGREPARVPKELSLVEAA